MRKNQTNHRKIVYSLSLVALLLVSGVTGASEPVSENRPALIILEESLEINDVAERTGELGGIVTHIFPPQVIIGQISLEIEESLIQDSAITVYRGVVDVSEHENWGKETKYAVTAWNNNYMGLSADAGLNELPVDPEPPPDDTEILPDISAYAVSTQYSGLPYGAEFQDTSEYLVGSVAVGVLLLESNGTIDDGTENWTEEEEANVTSEIQNGLNWLANQEPNAHLTFVYEWHYSIPVGYEPITRPHTDDDMWEQQAMFYLGYTNSSYVVNEYAYANDLRQKYKCDWAFIIFVVDSSEDEDNAFSDGYYAYAFLGGPRMVVTYSNFIWGISSMDSIVAHETCHIFWALDEHCTSQVDQTAVSGYLGGVNANSEWNGESCTATAPCIMKGEPMVNSQIEGYTREQLGWRDSDFDGILDVLDTVPEVVVDQQETYITGTAKVSPLSNMNPLKEGNPISLNIITTVQYSLDQQEWIEAEPTDGSFDEPEEEFAFTVGITLPGEYTVYVRAQNSAGNWSEPLSLPMTIEEPGIPVGSCLQSEISVSPSAVDTGDTVSVTMTVQNTGDALISGIVPALTAPEGVEKISGPEPESADCSPQDSVTFTWVYQVNASEGTLVFSGSVTGTTESGEEVSSPASEVTVEVGVEPVRISDITALLYGIIEGDTITVTMEVNNAGEVILENVTPSELALSLTGTVSASLISGPLPESITQLEPGTTRTFEWKYVATPGPLGGTAVFAGNVTGNANDTTVASETVIATVGVQSPAVLTAFIIATPKEVLEGDMITVAVTIQNIGQADAVDVIPSELKVTGTGKVTLESGPSRTSMTVKGRSFEIILWTYVAVQEGTVVFSGSGQGIDTSTGESVTVPEKQSNPVVIGPGETDTDTDDTDDTDTDDTDDTDTDDTDDTDTDDSDESETPPSTSTPQCVDAQKTIQKARELLSEAKTTLEEKQKQRRDVRVCLRLYKEAETLLAQADYYLKIGNCEEAYKRAIAALMKVHELLNCLARL